MTSNVITLYIKKIKIHHIKLSKYFLIFHQYITDPTKLTKNPIWYSPFAIKLTQIPSTQLYIHIYQKTFFTTNYISSIPLPLSTLSLNKYYKQRWHSSKSKFTLDISFLLKDSEFNPDHVETIPIYEPNMKIYLKDLAIDLPDPDDRCPFELQG